jgi:hypothetical protein
MSQPRPRQTKKQKKALAFRTRQKTGKKKNNDLESDEDALGFPVDENQDLAGLADLPLEVEEIPAGGRPGGRKGKAQDGGQRPAQPLGSKKRKREGEDSVVEVEEKARKKSKVQPTAPESGVEGQNSAVVKKGTQPQRFILFIGAFRPSGFE